MLYLENISIYLVQINYFTCNYFIGLKFDF